MFLENLLFFVVSEVSEVDFRLFFFLIEIKIQCDYGPIFQNEIEVFVLMVLAVSTHPVLRTGFETQAFWMHSCNCAGITDD